jgi:predicted nucleic acid-binding protein
MTWYLLDSDAVIDYLKGFPASVALIQQLDAQGDALCSCDVVVAEVYSGLDMSDRPRAQRLFEVLTFLVTSPASARQAGEWRAYYKRQGHTLSTTDCLIAGVAWEHGATIVTGNTRHYPMPEVTLLPLPRRGPATP